MNLKYFIVKDKNKNYSIHVRFWDSKRIGQKTHLDRVSQRLSGT
jgi:hypothetical protein